MSGGSDTTTTTNFPDWAVPYAQNYQAFASQVANQPYQAYGGQTVAQLNPYQTAGYDAMSSRAMQGSPVSDAASSSLTDTLNGKYLNSNPYLDQIVKQSQNDVVSRMDQLSARSGSFGNTGGYETTARTLGDLSANIRGQDYANERNRQVSALGYAPSIANQDYTDAQQLLAAGQGYQAQDQRNLTDQYNRFQEAQNYPQQQLATLGKGLGLNFGSTTTGPSSNGMAQGLGTALSAYGAYNMLGGGAEGKG
jgi:hypothetical protein